jgi:hypothetical protein
VSSHSHSATTSLNRTVTSATAHCLTGCAIGEVLGLAIGTAAGLSNTLTIVLAILGLPGAAPLELSLGRLAAIGSVAIAFTVGVGVVGATLAG